MKRRTNNSISKSMTRSIFHDHFNNRHILKLKTRPCRIFINIDFGACETISTRCFHKPLPFSKVYFALHSCSCHALRPEELHESKFHSPHNTFQISPQLHLITQDLVLQAKKDINKLKYTCQGKYANTLL